MVLPPVDIALLGRRADLVQAIQFRPRHQFVGLLQSPHDAPVLGRGHDVALLHPSSAQDLVHLRRRLALQRRHDVGVRVQRHPDLRMAEGLHDGPDVDPLR